LEDLSNGSFQPLIPEIDKLTNKNVERIILCSGKVYYDLLEKRREEGIKNVAILRLEQLYPFPIEQIEKELKRYASAKEVVWCQEEPRNQGAWYRLAPFLSDLIGNRTLLYAGRSASASTAAGYLAVHRKEQEDLVWAALSSDNNEIHNQVEYYVGRN
jgi:2-oxoglutarate dehydrogenase E1 component